MFWVSVFFFFSGYGLTYNYDRKGNAYLCNFIRGGGIKLLLPLIIAYALTLPVYEILVKPVDFTRLLKTLLTGGEYLMFTWYVSIILIVYLIFYVVMRSPVRESRKSVGLTISIVVFMIVMSVLNQPLWFIISLPSFILGIWFYRYEKYIVELSNSTLYRIIAGFVVVWLITWFCSMYGCKFAISSTSILISTYITNLAFTMALMFFCVTLPTYNINVSDILLCSYEIYLMQRCAFIFGHKITDSLILFIPVTLILSVVLGYIAYKINKAISSCISLLSVKGYI